MTAPVLEEDDDPFAANEVYPDAAAVFTGERRALNDIKSTCLVVLDTNVLLIPYTISPKNLEEIGKSYRTVATRGDLVVPAHVAREFARNRAKKLAELHQQITRKRAKLEQLHTGKYPLLESVPGYADVVQKEAAIDEQVSNYRKALMSFGEVS